MNSSEIPVVVYGVKSSPDEKESVRDQHAQVLAAIKKEGGQPPGRGAVRRGQRQRLPA